MNVLGKKLLRSIWHTKGQFLAVTAVVTVGIAVFIGMSTALFNLEQSKNNFYREYNFADYYFHVIRAPQQVTHQLEQISGVVKATGRIQVDVPLLKEDGVRGTARLISYPLPMDREVNRLHLQSGRLFEKHPSHGGVEVLVDPQYQAANKISFNNSIYVVAGGKKAPLLVVGTGTSPEFVYPIMDAATLIPDPATFCIVMLPLNQAQEILNQPGEINQIAVNFASDADSKKITEEIKEILKPYGNLADYPQKDQLSNAVLQGELDGLKAASSSLPVIFLIIAAAIQFVMLGRMVKAQRMQVGVMKAIGFGNWGIMLYYTGYALMSGVLGAALGTILGVIIASFMSAAYAMYFNLPRTIGGINLTAVFYGFLLSIGISTIAGLSAVRGVVSIHPAESMLPDPPKGHGKVFLERWSWFWKKLDPTWRMAMRTLGRNKVRLAIVIMGIVFATGLLVVSLFMNDAMDYMLTKHYSEEQRYNYQIKFSVPVKESDLYAISCLEGVNKLEPVLEVPVKMNFAGRSEDDVLLGLPRDLSLRRLTGIDGEMLKMPAEGVLINERTAEKLGVQVGDIVQVETLFGIGPSRKADIKVAGINKQLIGGGSFMDISQVNRVLRESGLVSGAMLKVDQGMADEIESALNEMTNISSVLSREKEKENFYQNMDSMIFFVGVMIFFAVILGFAIVYNSSVVSFGERQRELASLRVLGFSIKEVSALIWKEYLLQSVLGIVLGLPFGYLMAKSYVNAVSTDLYDFPVVVYPLTYFYSALGGIVFVVSALLFTVRGVGKLDLVDVLKNRD